MQRRTQRRAFAHVLSVKINLVFGRFGQRFQNFARAVFGTVVNDDEFFSHIAQIDGFDAGDDFMNGFCLVVHGHQNRK